MVHTYAIHGYGVWLPNNVAEEFARRYAGDEDTDVEDGATLDEVAYDCGGSYVGKDSDLDGVMMYLAGADGDEDEGVFLYSNRQGSVFASDGDLLYKDRDDMVRDIVEEYGKWLPDGFDVKSHTGEFFATFSD